MTDTGNLRSSDVVTRSSAAYWYAVGFSDGRSTPDRADEFYNYVRVLAEAYYVDHTSSTLHSIPDQFRAFMGW